MNIKLVHAIRYYQPHYELISNLIKRAHVLLAKTGLRTRSFSYPLLESFIKLSNKERERRKLNKNGMFGMVTQVSAVAAFRSGMLNQKNTLCTYCHLDVSGSSKTRHGKRVF